jgi:hypothetical protein
MTEQPPPIAPTQISAPPPPPPSRGVFGTKIPTSVTLAIAIVLFFMPFLDIKCNNMSLQKISGLELATGFSVKSSNDSFLGNLDKLDNTGSSTSPKGQKKDPNIYALAALGFAVLGLILSLLAGKAGGIGAMLTSIVGAVSLILLLVDIKSDIKTEIGDASRDGVSISVDFTPVFYITIIVFLAAAYFGYRRTKS